MDAKWGAKGWIWRGIGTAMVLALAGFAMHGILSATAGEKAQATPEILAEGKALYEKKCAVCHGTDGRGDGSAAYLLYPKPRDFTSGRFKIHSTMTLPTDQDLFNSITNGIAGTSMPSWAALTEQDRWAMVAYVKSLSPVFQAQSPGEPVAIPKVPPRSPRLLALGKKFYKEAGRVRLQPANPTMQAIVVDPDAVQIQGVVVGVMRKY